MSSLHFFSEDYSVYFNSIIFTMLSGIIFFLYKIKELPPARWTLFSFSFFLFGVAEASYFLAYTFPSCTKAGNFFFLLSLSFIWEFCWEQGKKFNWPLPLKGWGFFFPLLLLKTFYFNKLIITFVVFSFLFLIFYKMIVLYKIKNYKSSTHFVVVVNLLLLIFIVLENFKFYYSSNAVIFLMLVILFYLTRNIRITEKNSWLNFFYFPQYFLFVFFLLMILISSRICDYAVYTEENRSKTLLLEQTNTLLSVLDYNNVENNIERIKDIEGLKRVAIYFENGNKTFYYPENDKITDFKKENDEANVFYYGNEKKGYYSVVLPIYTIQEKKLLGTLVVDWDAAITIYACYRTKGRMLAACWFFIISITFYILHSFFSRFKTIEESKRDESHKLEALSILGGSISSDLARPLEVLHLHCEDIESAVKNHSYDQELRPFFLTVNEMSSNLLMIKNISSYIGQLHGMFDEQKSVLIQLNIIVENSVFFMKEFFLKELINLEMRLDPFPIAVEIIPNRIEIVFRNVFMNAYEALKLVSDLRLKTIVIETFLDKENKKALVKITDNGIGIRESELEHLFDPLYTTKKGGDGFGIGLLLAQTIMSEAGGDIQIGLDKENRTTVVTIIFPYIF